MKVKPASRRRRAPAAPASGRRTRRASAAPAQARRRLLPHYFIDRPVLAWVIAILIMIGGGLAIRALPAAAYPDIAPPQVSISAVYPGANADTIERTVTQIIEQQLTGIDKLLYFTSSSNSNGSASITLVFENGTDPDVAVRADAEPRRRSPRRACPAKWWCRACRSPRSTQVFIMALGVRSKDNRVPSDALNNIVSSQVLDPIQRIPGVSRANQFGSAYSMRIWLNPDKLRSFRMSAAEVLQRCAARTCSSPPAPSARARRSRSSRSRRR